MPPVARGHRAPILALLAANAVSLIGNNLSTVAIPWFVLETTGSAAKTGLVAFATVLPTVLAAFFGGALVDRTGNKRVSIVSDAISGITVAAIALLHEADRLEFWQLLALVFLGALLDTPGSTARMAIVPDVAVMGRVSLERANSAFQFIQSFSVFLGPPLAGLLIVWIGASRVLLVDAATFAVSALLVALLVPGGNPVQANRTSYWADVKVGISFLVGDRLLITFVAIGSLINFAGAPLYAVVLPVFARETYGDASDLGLILGGAGAGSLIGALFFGLFGSRLPRRRTLIALLLISSLPIAVLALNPLLWIAVAAMLLSGFGDGSINPLGITFIHERVPAELRGRVLGTVLGILLLAAPLGMLLAGSTIEWFGVEAVVLILTVILLAAVVLLATTRLLNGLDDRPGETVISSSLAEVVRS